MSIDNASDIDVFEEEATANPSDKPETVPSKYVGKTVEDLIKMHQNAERKVSEQGRDLGQMRKMADQLLELKPIRASEEKPTQAARQPVTVETLLNDPEAAIKAAVEASPLSQRTQAAEARAEMLERKLTEKAFIEKHPSFKDDLEDPAFTEWVHKNPARSALGQAAASQNYEAAASLWDMWQERKELEQMLDGKTPEKATRKTTPAAVASRVKSTPTDYQGQKVFSRAKLMELRMKVADGNEAAVARWNDPEFTKAMHQAYAEGRVR